MAQENDKKERNVMEIGPLTTRTDLYNDFDEVHLDAPRGINWGMGAGILFCAAVYVLITWKLIVG